MKILLNDGTEKDVLMVTGGSRYVNGANRDCLNFIFDENTSMDELDALFTEQNCETIKIIGNDGSEAVYNEYTVRSEIKQSFEVVENENPDATAQTVKRVTVSMGQRSYMEKQLALIADEVTNTQLALCELYEGGLA